MERHAAAFTRMRIGAVRECGQRYSCACGLTPRHTGDDKCCRRIKYAQSNDNIYSAEDYGTSIVMIIFI